MLNDHSWLKQFPIAHRGLHNNSQKIPENSMSAFQTAIANNYAIELDVFVMGNDKVIVFHDKDLLRMCNSEKLSNTLDLCDYQLYSLSGTNEKIPLLDNVLRIVDGKVPIIIEIKDYSKTKKANMIILNTLLGYKGHIAVQSFNPFVLSWFAKYAPTIPRGQLSSDFKNESLNIITKFLLRNLLFNFMTKPHFIAYDIRALPNKRIERLRRKGKLILGWTVDTSKKFDEVKNYCDNIIFEGFQPHSERLITL